jgi:ribosomal protein S18 acetylase RimI-like enzyme
MSARMLELRIFTDSEAIRALSPGAITNLTEAATGATFDHGGLTDEQRAANRRVVDISEATAQAAAVNAHQHLAAAFADGRFAGFVIATKHAPDDHELDWLMVHPDFHGTNVADALMRAGMAWLGEGDPMWLNVIRHNARAIRFYEKRGFKIDPMATTAHVVPHHIMRRPPAARS